MNNPIKNQFQKVYNETGKKPFTFLNCFLTIFLPIIIFIASCYLFGSSDDIPAFFAANILGLVVGWGINLALLWKSFQKQGISLFFLNILASIAFFCSFVIWPLIKLSYRASQAIVQANLGNTTGSVNASKRAGATKGRMSALNWFEYNGDVWENEKEVMPEEDTTYSADEGAYSSEQNQKAQSHGYRNGKEAELSGRRWNGFDWI